jgi:hypothetical protein
LGTQKSAKTPPAGAKMIRPFSKFIQNIRTLDVFGKFLLIV